MRRKGSIFAAVIAVSMAFALVACSGKSASTEAGSDSASGTSAQTEEEDAQTETAGGAKSLAGSVQIASVKDLEEFCERVNGGETTVNAELTADLDLAEVCGEGIGSWTPIAEYNGTFEGNGHTIRGLYLATEEDYAGLFGRTDGEAVIQNLALADVSVSGGEYAGAVAGYSEGTIRGCQVSGSVSAKRCAGGIAGAGSADTGTSGALEDCTNEAEVFTTEESKKSEVGGIVGWTSAHVKNCVNTGAVHSECAAYAGGIVGKAEGTDVEAHLVRIENCSNSGNVDGTWYAGGLVGSLRDGLILDGKNTGTVSGYYEVGGISGAAGGKQADYRGFSSMFVNCANTGEVQLCPLAASEEYELAGEYINDDLMTQEIGGITANAYESAFVNCRNAGSLILETSHAFSGVGHIDRGTSNLYLNCVSTAQMTLSTVEEREDFIKKELMNAAGTYGGKTANLYYVGDACDENVEPVSQEALTDGTVLNALNSYPDGIPEEYLSELAESGIEFEVCGWKQGADGTPILDWEE